MINNQDPMMPGMDSEEQQRLIAQRDAARLRDKILFDSDFKTLANTAEGRRFLRRLLAECGVYQLAFTAASPDTTAFKEGRRSIGLWLLSLFEGIPETYIQLLTEKANDY